MESTQPMDRLLCGDVGYGKTEIAMRAAFKAISDNKQVAVLAPTTVLAFQHYETFKQRFAAFPVAIEMISRFRSPKQQKEILQKVEAGKVDILIGTHRLISKDVKFADLGLLVVDEEQRFGVRHKERLKQMRKQVDVLTMSATPIPRTLHMSLVGLRDMSVIETPPKDRIAIQTVVASWDEKLIQSAIEQELERGGQVFFVHNRVDSIWEIAAKLQALVPRARVIVGHGQMSEGELEKVMLKFMHHEADILVSTTIIENGLDIPLCNTILINRADRLGLSELYQLRGRVGRSNRRAYAYLLLPAEIELTPIARRRLAALKEFSDLGRRLQDCSSRSRAARRRQYAGRPAERTYRSRWFRALHPDARSRRARDEGRSRRGRSRDPTKPGTQYPHPSGIHPGREPASANVQAGGWGRDRVAIERCSRRTGRPLR